MLFERETRLELATPTLARLCSTNWAILAWSLNFQTWCKNTSIFLFHQEESKKKKKRQSCKPGSVLRLPWASIIDLGCYSRNTSIGLPSWPAEAIERAAQDQVYLTFQPVRFVPILNRSRTSGLLPHFFTLTSRKRRFCFLWHFLSS